MLSGAKTTFSAVTGVIGRDRFWDYLLLGSNKDDVGTHEVL